ncbi:MAG: hypothetical protein ABSF22_14280 [Bryobacteraceae bacterium]
MSQHDTPHSNFLAQQESCNSALEAIAKATTATALVQSEPYRLAIEAITDATALAQSSNAAFHAIADAAGFAPREPWESIEGASISMAAISAPQVDASMLQSAIQAHSDILAAVSDGICQIDAETSRIWQECIGSSYPEPYAVSLALSNEWDLTIPGVPNVGTELALLAAQYGKAELIALERDLRTGCLDYGDPSNAFTVIGRDPEIDLLAKYFLLRRFASRTQSSLENVVRFILQIVFAIPKSADSELCDLLNTYRSFFELHGMGRPPCLGWAC